MKRLNLLVIGTLICAAAFAQKKPKINRVDNYLKDGKIAEAKEIVDAGIEHRKTKDKDDTWFLRALTYTIIDTTAAYEDMAENPLQTAIEAFDKADELRGGKEPYLMGENGFPVTMTQYRDRYFGYYFNIAAQAFQNQDFETAVEGFEAAQVITPSDTNVYTNAAYAAQNAGMMDRAIENYEKALDKGAKSKDIYSLLSYLYISEQQDTASAVSIIKSGREIYPSNADLLKSQIDLYIKTGKVEEAKQGLTEAIEKEPDNVILAFTLGSLYDQNGQVEKALQYYDKALEIDPEHYESNYNKAVLLLNLAQDVIKERNNLGTSKADMKKSEELTPLIKQKLKEALPQWEKVREVKPDDITALETLQYIYVQLRMKEEAEEVEKAIESLQG